MPFRFEPADFGRPVGHKFDARRALRRIESATADRCRADLLIDVTERVEARRETHKFPVLFVIVGRKKT